MPNLSLSPNSLGWKLACAPLAALVSAAILAGCSGARAGQAGHAGGASAPQPQPAPFVPPLAPVAPAGTPRPTPSAPQVIEATLSEYSVWLSETEAQPGVVRFTIKNVGQRRHNLRVAGNGVDKVTRDLGPNGSATLEATFREPGPYTVYCDLADHADRGMTQSLTIEP